MFTQSNPAKGTSGFRFADPRKQTSISSVVASLLLPLIFLFLTNVSIAAPADKPAGAMSDSERLQVYEKAIADLQKWRDQIKVNGLESQSAATWAMVGDGAKTLKALADVTMDIAGEAGKANPATKALATRIKGAYDVANAAIDAAYNAKTGLSKTAAAASGISGAADVVAGSNAPKILGPAADTLQGINKYAEGKNVSAAGYFTTVIGHIADLVGKDTMARYVKDTGSVIRTASDLAETGKEFGEALQIRQLHQEDVDQIAKVDQAIAGLQANKQQILERNPKLVEQAAGRTQSPATTAGKSDTLPPTKVKPAQPSLVKEQVAGKTDGVKDSSQVSNLPTDRQTLKVEAIKDANQPTKIIVLNKPTSSEVSIQDALQHSAPNPLPGPNATRLPSTQAGVGESGTANVRDGAASGTPTSTNAEGSIRNRGITNSPNSLVQPPLNVTEQQGIRTSSETGDTLAKALNQDTRETYGPGNPYARDSLIPETPNHLNPLSAGDLAKDSSQSSLPSKDSQSLQVESISDPNLPTKILVLRPPTSAEIGLQNPLSGSHQITLTNAAGGSGDDPASPTVGRAYDPSKLSPTAQAGREATQSAIAKLPSTLKKTPNGLAYDPTGLTAAERAGRDVNQEIVASETKLPSTLKKTPDGLAYDPTGLTAAERAGRDVNQEIVASETKLPSTLKKTPDGLAYDPTGLTAAERAGRDVNQEIVASETKLPSTLKKTPDGLAYDPTGLTAAERAGRDVNQEIVASETKLPSTLKKTPDGLAYDPTGLTAAERAGRDVNQAIMAKETLPKSFQQQMWDWAAQTFPETMGPGSAGLSFGDMSTHIGAGGEKATPSISACLDPNTCTQRYFNKSFTVTSGDNKVVAGGFGDVNFLNGGYFAANAPGGGAYTVYNAEGKALPIGQIVNPQKATVGEDGTLKTVDSWGNTHEVNLPNVITTGNATIATQQYAYTKSLGGGAMAGTQVLNSTNWDVFDTNGNRIGSYQQVKALGNGAFAVSNDPLGDASPNWTVLDLSGHQIGNGPYSYVAASGSRIAVEKIGDNSFSYLDPPPITQQVQTVQQTAAVAPTPSAAPAPVQVRSTPAVPLPAVGGQSTAPTPATGGIYLGGEQKLKETQGVDSQFEEARKAAEVIPGKKKKRD